MTILEFLFPARVRRLPLPADPPPPPPPMPALTDAQALQRYALGRRPYAIDQSASLETYWSKDRIVTARFLKEHTPYATTTTGALYECSCGWHPAPFDRDPNAWTVHLTDALNAAAE